MADQTAASQLRFEIVGDNSQLKAAFAEIEKANAKTAEAMAKSFDGSSSKIGAAAALLVEKFKEVNNALTQALKGGAEGVEGAVMSAFNSSETFIKKSLDGMVDIAALRMGKLGKIVTQLWSMVSKDVADELDKIKKNIAEKGADALRSDVGKETVGVLAKLSAESAQRDANLRKSVGDAWSKSSGVASGVVAAGKAISDHYLSALTGATQATDELGEAGKAAEKKILDLAKTTENAFDVVAGNRMGKGAFDAIIKGLDETLEKQKLSNELIGKSSSERAKILARRQADELGADGTMADDQTAKQEAKIDEIGTAAQEGEDKQRGIRQAEQLKNILASLQERLELEMATTQEVGKTTAEVARQQAEARFNLQIAKVGITLTAEQVKQEKEKLDAIQRQVQLKTEAKVNRQIDEQGQQELIQLQRRMDAFGQSAGAQAEAAFTAKAYADSIKQVGYVTDDVIKTTERWAPAIRQATDAQEAMKRNFQTLQDTGQVVARGLETAFAKWTEGGKVSVREMVSDMMANMAQLAFKNSVSQLLFGASGNASNGGGLFGSLGTTLFGGMREAGGPVTAGVPYVVGEKRPELFVPKQSGWIMPEVPQGSAQRSAPNINLSIDARGATADAVEKLRAQIPSIIMGTMREAQSRGAFA